MDLSADRNVVTEPDPMELVETCLAAAGWDFQRDEDDDTLQCLAQSQWGEMGGMFAVRQIRPHCIFPSLWMSNRPPRGAPRYRNSF